MTYRTVRLVALARTEDDHSAASDEQDTTRRKGNRTSTAGSGQGALLGVSHVGRADVEVLLVHARGGRGVAVVRLVEGDLEVVDLLVARRDAGLLEVVGASSETVDVDVAVGVGDDLTVVVLDAVGVDVGDGTVSVVDRELRAGQSGAGRGDLLEDEAVGLDLWVGRVGADLVVLVRVRGEGAVGLVADLTGLDVDRDDLSLVLDADLLGAARLEVIPVELHGEGIAIGHDGVVRRIDRVIQIGPVVDLNGGLIDLETGSGTSVTEKVAWVALDG